MENKKVRFTMVVTREYEIDLADYQNMGSEKHPLPPCQTIEEASNFDCECIAEVPFAFIDDKNTELIVTFEGYP